MTIRILLYPYFLLCPFFLIGQNLVPDPGFEIHSEECLGYPPLSYWYNPNTATPDLRSVEGCGTILTENSILNSGLMWPNEGNSYIGLYCFYESGSQTREYLTTELTEVLEEGEIYQISFLLGRRTKMNYAIDRFGIYFSPDSVFFDYPTVANVTPQWMIQGEILQPDSVWMMVTGEYVAEGNEKFITVGNFWHPDEMLYENVGTSWKNWNSGYYLFDQVSIEKSNSIHTSSISPKITFAQGNITIVMHGKFSCEVYDISGRKIVNRTVGINNLFFPIDASPGVYLVRVKSGQKVTTGKICIK